MDAFELLLRVSDANLDVDGDVKDFKPKFQMKPSFDYREHMESTMLDPIDSIMMLADQASQKSPIKKRSGAVPDSPDYRVGPSGAESFATDNSAMGTLLQYGSYFNMGSPLPVNNNRRSRAMSEPWIRQENWSEELQFNRTMGTNTSGNSGNPGLPPGQGFSQYEFGGFNRDLSVPRGVLYNAEQDLSHRLGYSAMETSLPQMMDQYSSIYNKNGRIGIYTREERSAIIHRFREKRKRRVWKKKIRYFCRKNLADRRVRVKGRFVKSAAGSGVGGKSSTSSTASDSPTNTTTSSMGGGTPSRTRGVRSGSAGTDITEDDDVRRSALANATNAGNAYRRTYTTAGRSNRTAQVQSPPASAHKTNSRAKQALQNEQSDEESEVEEEVEEDEESEDERGEENSMDVVVGSGGSVSTISTTQTAHIDEHKPRRFKLVLTSTDPTNAGIHPTNSTTTTNNTTSGSDSDANFMLHLHTSPSRHANANITNNTTSIKSEEVSGVDLLASLAAKSLDESDDYDEQEDEDVFSSEMLRLPGHKRIRRHSIAY